MSKEVIIPDEEIVMVWECPECKEGCRVDPTFYQDNGTPMCQCGDDMEYKHTIIIEED